MSPRKFIINIDPSELVPKSSARLYYFGALWVAIAMGGVIAFYWSYIPTVVPLFFTEPWGEARLAPKLYLALLPSLALISTFVNMIIGSRAKNESSLLSYALAISSLLISSMFAVSLWGVLQSLL